MKNSRSHFWASLLHGGIEDWVLVIVAVIYLVVTVGGEFGVLPLSDRVKDAAFPALTVVLLIALAKKVTSLGVSLEALADSVAELKDDDWGTTKQRVLDRVAPEIHEILPGAVESILDRLVEKKTLHMARPAFDAIYLRAYSKYQGDVVVGPSLAHQSYYWTAHVVDPERRRAPSSVEQEIAKFTSPSNPRRGHAKRIFYVPPGWKNDEYVLGVLARQVIELGVQVKVIEVPDPTSKTLYVVFRNQRFGWDAVMNGPTLVEFRFTRDDTHINNLLEEFDHLWDGPNSDTVLPASHLGAKWKALVDSYGDRPGIQG